jgi:glycosyltransferase involved in cell wall biosynthesis
MNILFIHQNFPGQFKHLAPALAARGHNVVAIPIGSNHPANWDGVDIVGYQLSRMNTPNIYPHVIETETKIIRGVDCFKACQKLKQDGFQPDVIIAHPGWGDSLFVKEVWPKARLAIYCEFHYHSAGSDVNFDPEFSSADETDVCRVILKNINNLLHFEATDAGISPTKWQASTFPERFKSKITVIHDGIDSDVVAPNPNATLGLSNGLELSRQDEIITFVNRNLEPYRGYHIFMRALPEILKRRPEAKVLIVGGNDISYGARSSDGRSWRDIFIEEVRPQISDTDWSRVLFLGNIPYEHFIPLLQISTVHVYLTYPFVLSWSLLEAMSVGCAIVASNTQPVREAIRHNDTGRLVDFFDVQGLAHEVCSLLDDPVARRNLSINARAFVKKTYDLKTVCLPRQIEWVEGLVSQSTNIYIPKTGMQKRRN